MKPMWKTTRGLWLKWILGQLGVRSIKTYSERMWVGTRWTLTARYKPRWTWVSSNGISIGSAVFAGVTSDERKCRSDVLYRCKQEVLTWGRTDHFSNIFTARRYASAVYDVVVCLFVRGDISPAKKAWKKSTSARMQMQTFDVSIHFTAKTAVDPERILYFTISLLGKKCRQCFLLSCYKYNINIHISISP